MGESEFDVAVLGAGGAGLSVVVALDRLARRRRAAGEDVTVPSVVLVDPVVRAGEVRKTGLSAYLELDYVDPDRFPTLPVTWTPEHAYIPSAPGTWNGSRNGTLHSRPALKCW